MTSILINQQWLNSVKCKDSNCPPIFWDCPKIKHHILKSQNTINLSQIQAFSSSFKEYSKFLFFHSPKNLFFYKLTSSSLPPLQVPPSLNIFKSWWWCLSKSSSSLVHLTFSSWAFRTCAKFIIICKNRLEK